jgi:hypothetical protein
VQQISIFKIINNTLHLLSRRFLCFFNTDSKINFLILTPESHTYRSCLAFVLPLNKTFNMHPVSLVTAGTILFTASGTVLPLRCQDQTNPSPMISRNVVTGYALDTEIQLGNQTFQLQVDTGSSDTWVVGTGYRCFSNTNTSVELLQANCTFAPGSTYNANQSSTYTRITNETFGAHYGLGIVLGDVSTERVTLAGLTATNQTITVVNRAAMTGDGANSGILDRK